MRGGAALRVAAVLPVALIHYATERLLDWIAGPEEPFDYASRTTAEIDAEIARTYNHPGPPPRPLPPHRGEGL